MIKTKRFRNAGVNRRVEGVLHEGSSSTRKDISKQRFFVCMITHLLANVSETSQPHDA